MANLHNTLYVTSEGAYVAKSGESAVVKVDGSVRMQVPLHHLASIVCFGWAGVSPELMGACTEAAPSTRGPEWTNRWCSGCHANGIAG